MGVLAIHHVQLGFAAGDHARIRHFYGELLGLTEWRDGPGHALRFLAGGQRLDLVPSDRWQRPAEPVHLALSVHNLVGLRARLLAAGVLVDEERPLAGHRRLYAHDPAGNQLELLEPDPARGAQP